MKKLKAIKYACRPIIIVIILAILISFGCKKFVDIDPPVTNVSTKSAFKDDATATAILTGLYSRLFVDFNSNVTGTSFYTELSSDNLTIADPDEQPDLRGYYLSIIQPDYSGGTAEGIIWGNSYSMLYTINNVIEELNKNVALSLVVRNRLLGEAFFMRAFCYFYLVNIYGEVPLVLSTNYEVTRKLPRSPVNEVYSQIEGDLRQAEELLDGRFVDADVTKISTERVRPNIAAVHALQARVFLYEKKYSAAEAAATKVISQSSVFSFTTLDATFLKNSPEIIWALQPVENSYNTKEANIYILPSDGVDFYHPVYLSDSLLSAFEEGDDRANKWIGHANFGTMNFPYANKYKLPFDANSNVLDEYTIVFRISEQFLIRAEARNEQGNTIGAIGDLNALRTRSRALATSNVPNPLPNLSLALSQLATKSAIIHERQVELFTEWGHRWFDLKRTNMIDKVMTPVLLSRGGIWENYKSLHPIPNIEIRLNPSLKQNIGY